MSSSLFKSRRMRLLITTLAVVWLSSVAVAQPSADNAPVPKLAGGRSQFTQRGQTLRIPNIGGAVQEVLLLPQMSVSTVAQQGTETWISGRSNAPDVDGLFVASIDAGGRITALPTPPDREQPRGTPTFLLDHGKVAGLVWLEGERQETFSIRASQWNGATWSPVEVVSPSRGKEQTGLTATILTDGSWLAVWAAVDTDDDLWWSRRTRSGWSEPQRLHPDNEIPDILPAIAPAANGAFVAWSQYDGSDYRIRLGRLAAGKMEPIPFASGKGAVDAQFVLLDGSIGMLYSEVIPNAWSLVRLDPEGNSVERFSSSNVRNDKPLVVETHDRFFAQWPDLSAAGRQERSEMRPSLDPEP